MPQGLTRPRAFSNLGCLFPHGFSCPRVFFPPGPSLPQGLLYPMNFLARGRFSSYELFLPRDFSILQTISTMLTTYVLLLIQSILFWDWMVYYFLKCWQSSSNKPNFSFILRQGARLSGTHAKDVDASNLLEEWKEGLVIFSLSLYRQKYNCVPRSSVPPSPSRLHPALTLPSPRFTRCTRCITRCRLKINHTWSHSLSSTSTSSSHASALPNRLSKPLKISIVYGFFKSSCLEIMHPLRASLLLPNARMLARRYSHCRTLNGADPGSCSAGTTTLQLHEDTSSCSSWWRSHPLRWHVRYAIRHSVFARMLPTKSAIHLFANDNDPRSSRESTCSNTLYITSEGRSIATILPVPYPPRLGFGWLGWLGFASALHRWLGCPTVRVRVRVRVS